MALGRQHPDDSNEPFNMAYLAMRGSGAVNGVSRLHGDVSRRLFPSLFPRWPQAEMPVGHVTNGVHVPTWDSAAADELWTTTCGQGRWRGRWKVSKRTSAACPTPPSGTLRTTNRQQLITWARTRLARQLAASAPRRARKSSRAQRIFDPNVLTLGFARRFATYKRPNLLLQDAGAADSLAHQPAAVRCS